MAIGRNKTKLMCPPSVGNVLDSCHITTASVRCCIFFNIKDIPFGNCLFTIHFIPYLMRPVIHIKAEIQFILAMVWNPFFCKNTIKKSDIFFLHISAFKGHIHLTVCFLFKSKNHDSACFHIKTMNGRLPYFNCISINSTEPGFHGINLFRATTWDTQKAALFVYHNNIFIAVKNLKAKNFWKNDSTAFITWTVDFSGLFGSAVITIINFTHTYRQESIFIAMVE